MILRKYYIYFLLLSIFLLLISCKKENQHLIKNTGKTNFYEIIFEDKDKNKNIYRQSYYFLQNKNNSITVLKNDGDIVVFSQKNNGISKTNISNSQPIDYDRILQNHDLKRIVAFPIKEGMEWQTDDMTTIKLIMGFDRIYKTDLPFRLNNKIVKTNETINVNGRKIKNCIEISSNGNASFIPGPPLDKIKIEVTSRTWYTKDLGIVRYERKEKSDSATTGNIYYSRTLLLE